MIAIKKVKKETISISQKTKSLCEKLKVSHLIPSLDAKSVSFELHASTELANAMRRCINSELEVLIMDFHDQDFTSDDPFIILYELKKRINLIPVRQISKSVFSLNVVNNTDLIIPVHSCDIVEQNTSLEPMFSPGFVITYLRPGKQITINNIHMVSGTASRDGPAFSFPGKVMYECLDMPLIDDTNPELVVSSMNYTPSIYKLTIPPQRYVDPLYIINMAVKTLQYRLTKIYNMIKNSDQLYSSGGEITYSPGKAIYKIFDESYTIGALLVKYGSLVDTSITNIHYNKPHPSFTYIIIEVHHSSPDVIMMRAIDKIREDLNVILSISSE
jgi:hypothetical protein